MTPDKPTLTVPEFLVLKPRQMDGYFTEHALGYRREKVPPDGAGENGGGDMLVPPEGMPKWFALPPKGPIGFAYMAPLLTNDPWNGRTLRNLMMGLGYTYTLEAGRGCTVTFTRETDGRSGAYHMNGQHSELICALVAACLALGILKEE